MSEPVALRGHHLLCILAYIGKGYTAAFNDHFAEITRRINNGAPIKILSGPDDICGALRQGATITCAHARTCRGESVKGRDRMALVDVSRALQRPLLKSGDRLVIKKNDVRRLRQAFTHGGIRRACGGCQWYGLCTDISAAHYAGAKLFPPA